VRDPGRVGIASGSAERARSDRVPGSGGRCSSRPVLSRALIGALLLGLAIAGLRAYESFREYRPRALLADVAEEVDPAREFLAIFPEATQRLEVGQDGLATWIGQAFVDGAYAVELRVPLRLRFPGTSVRYPYPLKGFVRDVEAVREDPGCISMGFRSRFGRAEWDAFVRSGGDRRPLGMTARTLVYIEVEVAADASGIPDRTWCPIEATRLSDDRHRLGDREAPWTGERWSCAPGATVETTTRSFPRLGVVTVAVVPLEGSGR